VGSLSLSLMGGQPVSCDSRRVQCVKVAVVALRLQTLGNGWVVKTVVEGWMQRDHEISCCGGLAYTWACTIDAVQSILEAVVRLKHATHRDYIPIRQDRELIQ
jgi:hypothetical protein